LWRRLGCGAKERKRIFKNSLLVPNMSQMNPVQTLIYNFFKIDFYIIFSSTSKSLKWSIPFRLPNQNFVLISQLSSASYIPLPAMPSWFHDANNILWKQIMKLLMQFSTVSYFLPPRSKFPLQHSIFKDLCSLLDVNDEVPHP